VATATIYGTTVYSNDGWSLYGTGDPILAMSDADAGTLYYNYPANVGVPCTFKLANNGTPPSDFTGATITGVSLVFSMYFPSTAGNDWGTGSIVVDLNGTTTSTGTLTQGVGSVDITSIRPGGGSWVYTDFYNTTLRWGFSHNRNAISGAKQTNVFTCYMVVTYTPVTPPTAEFTVSTTTGTSPLSVNFTDQSTNSPSSWAWDFGDSSTSTVQNPVKVYSTTATSTYTVTLVATNAGGTDTETKSSLITVDPAATAVAAEFVASTTTGVANLSVDFLDQSTGDPAPASWSWNFGDSSTSTAQNPTHVYTTVGTYTVTLEVENTTPTTDTETKTSYITVVNGKPVPSFSVSTTTGTRPLTVEFTGAATNALPTSWEWDFGDGTGSIAQSPTHIYTTVGTFSPSLTVGNAIGTASTTEFVTTGTTTYTQLTVNFATITASFTAAPLQGYIPFTVRFTDESEGDANSWAWNFGDTEVSSEKNPTHTYYTNAGSATLTVTQTGFSDDYDLRHELTNYWKMEETTGTGDREDFISTVDITPTASVTQTTGKNDYGTQLGSGVSMTTTTGVTWTGAYSWSGWYKFDSVANTATLVRGYYSGGTTVPAFSKNAAVLQIITPGASIAAGTTALTTGTWYHLVMTFDGTSRYRMYLNGVLEVEVDDSTAASTATGVAVGPDAGSIMYVDELGRYGIEMGQDQISGLYNAGAGEFFDEVLTSDNVTLPSEICPILPDETWGYFFEEAKHMMMEPTHLQNVCEGFDAFGGMAKAVELAHKRITRFVIETAALRKEATLNAADTDTEDFALPTDLIELLRVEVDGVAYYASDPLQRDYDSGALNTYFQNDALSITIPGTFGTVPTVKVLYTYVPSAPSVPAPCTCPTPPATGPWGAFPLPYVLWWVIRYGLMADFFSQAGERNDPERAAKCEELFGFGVELYKTLYRGEGV